MPTQISLHWKEAFLKNVLPTAISLFAAAAGLFVYPNKGPVAANYGLEECRFLRPIYHNDTVYVRLTCKQKIDSDATRNRTA